MKKELLIDFETLGINPENCVVLDCSIIIFDRERFTSDKPYTVADITETKTFKISVTDQVNNYNYAVENSVIEFWSKQDKEVRAKIKPLPTDLTVKEFTDQFLNLVSQHKISYWWSRGNTFDPPILTRIFDDQGKKNELNKNLKYWAVRDMRTFIDAKLDFPKENGFSPFEDEVKWGKIFKKHDSSWDVLADVLRLQAIARAEDDLEQVKL
jgi:hypothetical protein